MNIVNQDSDARGLFCIETRPAPFIIVIFGASGDLAHRKLIPSLYRLQARKLLPNTYHVIGCGRKPLDDDDFRASALEGLKEHAGVTGSEADDFLGHCHYRSGGYDDPELYKKLLGAINDLNPDGRIENTVWYLSTPPALFSVIVGQMKSSGILAALGEPMERIRVVLEKPFGYDLDSAMRLNDDIHRDLDECQVYRIDHYLGKETVQNILMFRFANAIFEPVWNRRYIDNIQIIAAESIGVGHRAGYYDSSGLLRDMFQNHMMQMLSLVAMEAPATFEPDRVRDEKVKLLRSVRPFPVDDLSSVLVRARYGKGEADGTVLLAYPDEEGIQPDSQTETFVAAKMYIDNWRWQGVPFYLRSGKRLTRRESKIVIVFKDVPHSMFQSFLPGQLSNNYLVLNVQPEEGVRLSIEAKSPGPKMCMSMLALDFKYKDVYDGGLPDAYERLLLDAMLGDQTLFIREDDMEVAWRLFTPVLDAWRDNKGNSPLTDYPSGSWGPSEANDLVTRDGRLWLSDV